MKFNYFMMLNGKYPTAEPLHRRWFSSFCKRLNNLYYFRLISNEIPPFQGLAEHDFRVLEFQVPRGAALPGQRRLIAEANVLF